MLLREALLRLGRDYQILLRRGTPPPPSTAAASLSPPVTVLTSPTDGSSTHQKPTVVVKAAGASIFRGSAASLSTTRATVLDSFASDGAATRVLGGLVESAAATASAIPSIFLAEGSHLSSSSSPAVKTVATTTASSVSNLTGMLTTLRDLSKASTQASNLASRMASDMISRVLRRSPRSVRFALYNVQWRLTGSGVEKVNCVLRGRKLDLWIVESELSLYY